MRTWYSRTVDINFLAIDFDQTIVDIHTGGRWSGLATELSSHVRPIFRHFIECAHAASLNIAVVTFSPQVQLVSEVLRANFPAFADSVVIRGMDGSWSYEGRGSRSGKQSHMASAAEELIARHSNLDIAKRTTLLIDDDAKNCRLALLDGVRAIWLNPSRPNRLLEDIKKLK
jgi:hypothetical protein